jgi:hypothetical protein
MSDPKRDTGGWTADDAIMADLRSWLVEHGLAVLDDRYEPGTFGDQVVTFARPTAIRLVRERREWSIELHGPEGDWTWIGYWRGSQVAEGLSAADQSEMLREILTGRPESTVEND